VQFTVGCVPYLNAKPLTRLFHDLGERSPVRVIYDIPSRLPDFLNTEKAQAILVSSIEYLRQGDRAMVDGVSISSSGPVMSVRLLSKVPLREIQKLSLDSSSMTSNALARMLLRELFDTDPVCSIESPDLDTMLSNSDACVLIGDNGMRYTREDLHVLDLGEAWKKLTGFPFVWALWVGRRDLPVDLASWLQAARHYGSTMLDTIVADCSEQAGVSRTTGEHYLKSVMRYGFSTEERKGLRKFARMLESHDLLHPMINLVPSMTLADGQGRLPRA
jgi:chorismate dehydratase